MSAGPHILIAAVAAQRLAEQIWARRNTRRLRARGGLEVGGDHYPYIVLLHLSWLVMMWRCLPQPTVLHPLPLALFAVTEAGRFWVLKTLGPCFTTRIVTVPGAPLVTTGPYRYFRHPNYVIVAAEIALVPLAVGEPAVAALFSFLNAALLIWRIRVEDMALAPRRRRTVR